jgi:hypothetical protein
VAYARRRGGRAQERRGSSLVAHACLAAECVSLVTQWITERPTSRPVLSSNAPAVRINAEPPVSASFFSLGIVLTMILSAPYWWSAAPRLLLLSPS